VEEFTDVALNPSLKTAETVVDRDTFIALDNGTVELTLGGV
jgi:hypothetical protein